VVFISHDSPSKLNAKLKLFGMEAWERRGREGTQQKLTGQLQVESEPKICQDF